LKRRGCFSRKVVISYSNGETFAVMDAEEERWEEAAGG